MEGILENLLGRYAGKWSLCERGKRTELGPPGSLSLSPDSLTSKQFDLGGDSTSYWQREGNGPHAL